MVEVFCHGQTSPALKIIGKTFLPWLPYVINVGVVSVVKGFNLTWNRVRVSANDIIVAVVVIVLFLQIA